jgi:hypothetical protein
LFSTLLLVTFWMLYGVLATMVVTCAEAEPATDQAEHATAVSISFRIMFIFIYIFD